MDFLNEYGDLILVISFSVILIMLIFVLWIQKNISKHFSNAKFLVIPSVEYQTDTKTNIYRLRIYNQNINDVRVTSVGLLYKGQNIDYYQKYLLTQGLDPVSKIVIFSRDFMTLEIESDTLKSVILDINKGDKKVDKLSVYITDSLGIVTRFKAHKIRLDIKRNVLEDLAEKELLVKQQKQKIKTEIKEEKRIKKTAKKLKRKEKVRHFFLKLKNIFKRNHKK